MRNMLRNLRVILSAMPHGIRGNSLATCIMRRDGHVAIGLNSDGGTLLIFAATLIRLAQRSATEDEEVLKCGSALAILERQFPFVIPDKSF